MLGFATHFLVYHIVLALTYRCWAGAANFCKLYKYLEHLFSPLGKLARRAIYFADVFFFIFYFF